MDLGEFRYWQCACGAIYADPIHAQDFYNEQQTYLTDPRRYTAIINPLGQRWMIEQFERLYWQLTKPPTPSRWLDRFVRKKPHEVSKGRVLEIGAGVGFLTLFALARGWEAVGIEVSAAAAEFARDLLRVDVKCSTIEDYKTDIKFHAIIMVEVLEHFREPGMAIEQLRRFAEPGAVLFGTTPNTSSAYWKEGKQDIYVPQDHICLFNEPSLRHFAERAGITRLIVEQFGMGAKHDSNLMFAGTLN